MPALQFSLPETTSKTLLKRAGRSAMLWSIKRANFMRFALPRVEHAIRRLDEAIKRLSEPVEMVVGQGENAQIVKVMDYASLTRCSNAMLAAIESERQLLGFPSPGRRRDEAEAREVTSRAASVVDAQHSESAPAPAQTQAQPVESQSQSPQHVDAQSQHVDAAQSSPAPGSMPAI